MSKKVVNEILSYLVMSVGCALAAFSIGAILIPNLILDGGVNGISMMLYFNKYVHNNIKHTIFNTWMQITW